MSKIRIYADHKPDLLILEVQNDDSVSVCLRIPLSLKEAEELVEIIQKGIKFNLDTFPSFGNISI